MESKGPGFCFVPQVCMAQYPMSPVKHETFLRGSDCWPVGRLQN